MFHPTRRQSFTLLELAVVLILIGLAIAVVIPRIGLIPVGVQIRSMKGSIQAAMRDAAMRARTSGQTVQLNLDAAGNTLKISGGTGGNSVDAEGDADSVEPSYEGLPREYTLPRDVVWLDHNGMEIVADDDPLSFSFYPGGEAGGPPFRLKLGKREFSVAVDPLTAQALIHELQ